MTHHTQVIFRTTQGHLTKVDEGMLEVLKELRRLGVRTQFSCQGGLPKEALEAYVLGDFMSFYPVIRKIKRRTRRRRYSSESHRVAKALFSGYREFGIVRFYRGRFSGLCDQKVRLSIGEKRPNRYSYEIQLDNVHGLRTILRWPANKTPAILNLLRETT